MGRENWNKLMSIDLERRQPVEKVLRNPGHQFSTFLPLQEVDPRMGNVSKILHSYPEFQTLCSVLQGSGVTRFSFGVFPRYSC